MSVKSLLANAPGLRQSRAYVRPCLVFVGSAGAAVVHMRLRCVVCLRVPGAPIASAIRCLPGSLFGNAFAAVLGSGKGHGLENAREVPKAIPSLARGHNAA